MRIRNLLWVGSLLLVPAHLGAEKVTPLAQCQPETYVIFYDRDGAELSHEAVAVLDKAAASYRVCGSASLNLTGFSTRAASSKAQGSLTARRLRTAVAYLSAQGVPGGAILASSRSEDRRQIASTMETDLLTRRVEIVVGSASNHQ